LQFEAATPALMLDATADAKLIDCFVDQDIDLKRIDIKQNAIITWVYDRTGSKRFWERKSESPLVQQTLPSLTFKPSPELSRRQ